MLMRLGASKAAQQVAFPSLFEHTRITCTSALEGAEEAQGSPKRGLPVW